MPEKDKKEESQAKAIVTVLIIGTILVGGVAWLGRIMTEKEK